jgi:cytochrome b
MAHLPSGGVGQLATKDDLRKTEERLELKVDAMRHELLAEIHRTARNLLLSMTTIMAVLNGIVFTALKLS